MDENSSLGNNSLRKSSRKCKSYSTTYEFEFPAKCKFKLGDEVFVGSGETTEMGLVTAYQDSQPPKYTVNLCSEDDTEDSRAFIEQLMAKVGDFRLGDDVFAEYKERTRCGTISGIHKYADGLRYLVSFYPYPISDKRYFDECDLKKVTNSKEELLEAWINNIDMEVNRFYQLRYGMASINNWEVKNPNKLALLLQLMSKDRQF